MPGSHRDPTEHPMTTTRPLPHPATTLALALALAPTGFAPAHAATWCVDDSNELQATLQAAVANSEDDVVRLEAGIYRSTSPDGFVASNFSSQAFDLEISGGWGPGCLLRLAGLRSTIDGELQRPGLSLNGTLDVRGQLAIRNIQFLRGLSTNPNRAGGLTVNRGYDIVIESNLFRQNTLVHPNSAASGGLYALSEGAIVVRGNLFVDNDADSPPNTAAGAASVACYSLSASASFNNNTATGNTADVGSAADIGGVRVFGLANCSWSLANNILWDNAGLDLALDVAGVDLRSNDIDDRGGSQPPATMTGNLRVDPRFVSATNRRLQRGSPLVDAGINGPAGGLPASSFDGGPRVVAAVVDIGAYELDVLMDDGFDLSDFGR
jgi:hypothetical protein